MKNIFLFVFLCSTFNQAFSQDTLTFKVHYMPETTYHQKMTQENKMSINYLGSEEFLKKLKEAGIANPVEQRTTTTTEMLLKTGKSNSENYFPLTMEFINTPPHLKKITGDSLIIYGRGTIDSLPKLDSVSAKGINPAFKDMLINMLQSTFSQLDFPVKHLKVGETFTHEALLKIPFGSFSMDIVVNSAYHLLDIQNNIGAFDVTQTFIAKSDIAGSDMNVAGKGSGKMLYDVNHKFISKMDIQNFMDMHMKLNEMDAKMKMEMNISQTVNINRN